jgi:hypothetical protein
VHDWLEGGASPQVAADRAVAEIKPRGDIGIIVVGATEMAAAASDKMPWAARESGSATWKGP